VRITLIGYGNVGSALAVALATAGHQVTLATNPDRPDGAEAVRAAHPVLAGASVAAAEQAVAGADLVVLSVPLGALDALLPPLAPALAGTVVVDATNPVGPGLVHGLGSAQAGAHQVATLLPQSRVVKAFSVYGFENLSGPPAGPDGLRPVMPFAGDDPEAKSVVADLLDGLGWEPLDVGGLAAALDLEHLTLLWIRMVRGQGLDPHLVWAALRGSR
jgi:hypothetical protein